MSQKEKLSSYFTKYSLINVLLWIFLPSIIWYLFSASENAIIFGGILSIIGLIWHASQWGQTESYMLDIENNLAFLHMRNLEDIVTILDHVEQIYTTLNKILKIKESGFTRIISFFYGGRIINKELFRYTKSLYKLLLEVRKQLLTKIETKKGLLQQGKDNLALLENQGELSNLASFQSARLDRQIEQFEELQRVLVRM